MDDETLNRILRNARARGRRPVTQSEPRAATLEAARARGMARRAEATEKGVEARLEHLRALAKGKGKGRGHTKG